MRYDDRLATVLSQPLGQDWQREAHWRQLVDLLAQADEGADGLQVAFDRLAELRSTVPLDLRQRTARSLAGLPVHPDLVLFFAGDHPTVASEILRSARLSPDSWLRILPSLGPTARSLLRHRRDLPAEVDQGLLTFGASDLVLETSVATELPVAEPAPLPELAEGESQIRQLVARIEAFRSQKPSPAAAPSWEGEEVESFRWETGPDGIILWVEGAPRGPLVGQSIASIADRGQHGVDGQAAGAFHKRSPFRDARFTVAAGAAVSGDWRISGVPFFDAQRGNFLGYRGTARRPRLDEVARPEAESGTGVFGTELPADSLRQLIHELRTPLNAIVGFAEMIEGQYMGPAAATYRGRAAGIIEQAARLLSAVDDLDTAARIESRRLDLHDSAVDAAALLRRLESAYARAAEQRGASLTVHIADTLPPASVEPVAGERMIARMLAATIGLAQPGETIAAGMTLEQVAGRPTLCLAIDRPDAISGLDERDLLDPGYSPDGDWPDAPVLGLGFALRLVRNLAEAAGGGLTIGETRFFLLLPCHAADAAAPDQEQQG